ncbi:MAG TPA: Mu-like prophage major head subunit gpT family protein [Vicinamibacterales bacterium]|nr:Mu-like prophage major head subunit gpT family protein [Vicinamibacterales bacterium]
MFVTADEAQAVSTQYEAWFLDTYNAAVAVPASAYGNLILPLTLENFQGNRISLNWLGAAPQLREWVDEKRPVGISENDWEIVVARWEASIEVDLDALNDGQWRRYEPRIREMTANASRHRYNLISDLIKNGESARCYDGQDFFDTDHVEGSSGTQSNKLTGTGTTLDKVVDDFFSAKAALMTFKDDKGQPFWAGDFRPLIWAPATATMMQRFDTLRGVVPVAPGTTDIPRLDFDVVYDPRLTDANDWHMANPASQLKPFISVNREEMHYEDNFSAGSAASPDVFNRRVGIASVVGRDNMTYGMWQTMVKVKNGG